MKYSKSTLNENACFVAGKRINLTKELKVGVPKTLSIEVANTMRR